jgi:hypothetical protein
MTSPLGCLLFQRMSLGTQLFCRGLALTAFVIGLMVGLQHGFFLFMGGLWVVSAALVISSLTEFCVYECGVSQGTFRPRTLRYSELRSFQYGAVRLYQNGFYQGTSVSMRFTPGPGGKAITYTQTHRGDDAELDALRDQVAGIVAKHLLERLERGEDIRWGPSARFTQQGLVIRASKPFGSREDQRIPYDAELRCRIKEGHLYLFIGNEHLYIGHESGAAMTMACAVDNFYPGLKMLEALCTHVAAAPQASA